jgi:HEAT repeat protein
MTTSPSLFNAATRFLILVVISGECLAGESVLQLTTKEIPGDAPPGVRRAIAKTFSNDPKVRGRAAVVLGRMGSKAISGVPFLIRLLADPSEAEMREVSPFLIGFRTYSVSDCASGALLKTGAVVVEPLIKVVSNEKLSDGIRCAAVSTLGKTRDHRALGTLAGLTSDHHALIRHVSATALGELGDVEAVPTLLELAAGKSNDKDSRLQAISSLRRLGDRRAIPALLAIAAGPDADAEHAVKYDAVDALGDWKDARITELLLKLLKGKDEVLQRAACAGIARQDSEEGTNILLRILTEPGEPRELRYAAAKGLVASRSEKGIDLMISIVEKERKANGDMGMMEQLMNCLARSGHARALDRLFLWLGRDDVVYLAGCAIEHIRSREAVDRLIDVLKAHKSFNYVHTPENACLALCRVKTPEILTRLIPIFHDKNLPILNRQSVLLAVRRQLLFPFSDN